MLINRIWIGFFFLAIIVAVYKAILGDFTILSSLPTSIFEQAKKAVELCIGMVGMLAFWLGLLKIAENAQLIEKLSRLFSPILQKMFPTLPKGHPAFGFISLNFSANLLGLDNAATPLGLKAMEALQVENSRQPDTASNEQILFLAVNTAGLTLIPTGVLALRAAAGASMPSDIVLPCMLGTGISFVSALFLGGLYQKNGALVRTSLWATLFLGLFIGFLAFVRNYSPEGIQVFSSVLGNSLLLFVIGYFLFESIRKRLNAYNLFIEGAKEGFTLAISIVPYLLAILVGIGLLRESGVLDYIIKGISLVFSWLNISTTFVEALPVGLMKPFSGSGARGLMVEVMNTHGPDSLIGKMVCVMQGSTETTFYTMAVYYGAVKIKNYRYTLSLGLWVDFIGVVAAILLTYLFFY